MFTKGDKYIHFTKYGGVNIGEVEYYGYITNIDTTNKVQFRKYYISNTKGVKLELDGSDGRIFKVEKEYTDAECENLKKTIRSLGLKKSNQKEEIYQHLLLTKPFEPETMNLTEGKEPPKP